MVMGAGAGISLFWLIDLESRPLLKPPIMISSELLLNYSFNSILIDSFVFLPPGGESLKTVLGLAQNVGGK